MRQVGIIASAALFGLENNRERLKEDHANAKRLAEGLAGLKGIEIEPDATQTTITFFNTAAPAAELVAKMKEKDILMLALETNRIRAVTNLMVTSEMIEEAIETITLLCR